MELTLTLTTANATLVTVACDGLPSHSFDLRTLMPDSQLPDRPPQPLDDPIAYGKAVYYALFPPGSPSRAALDLGPERLLLVADDLLDSIPWEFAHDAGDFIVLDLPFVRGVPAEQRIAPPTLDAGLHIVAVPANPLDANVPALNIDGEWERLAEIVQEVHAALTLERTRPPTLAELRRRVANQRNRVVHFMGHGGQTEQGAILCFEQDDGGLAPATAREFVRLIRGTVFLVTLNACVSATPGETEFGNLAAALVRQKVPYALGMRFSVLDDDARAFSRVLYSELARGVSVEEAVQQVRIALARSQRAWAVGVPALYSALNAASPGFSATGAPQLIDQRPRLELVPVLPRAEGAFQGRIAELRTIGSFLTSNSRPRVLTIHGAGGQGKTVLAREAVERFAWAWPGGVVALSLESLPSREQLIGSLARFLGIDVSGLPDPAEIERQVLALLGQLRTLVVLDNAETLTAAVEAGQPEALRLAQLIREQVQGPQVTLLVTSRELLGWPGEEHVGLGGLDDDDGAQLFRESAPQRHDEIELTLALELSRKVAGHPLSLRLLGSAFNQQPSLSLSEFVERHEEQLLAAENKYVGPDHRHRNLYASIDTSVRYLDDDLRALLSGLWVFHAPFLPDLAAAVFDPAHDERSEEASPVFDRLYALWQRGLLVRTITARREGNLLLYRLLPTLRPYAERYLAQAFERESLLTQFAAACAGLVQMIYGEIKKNTMLVRVAQQCREDLERGLTLASNTQRGAYQLQLGWILGRLGDRRSALTLTEAALEASEGTDQDRELSAMNNLALLYRAIGQPQRALLLFEQALTIEREVGDRVGEAATLSNIAGVYRAIGQPQRALLLFEQALTIEREVGDHADKAVTLNNQATVYDAIGQPQRALQLYEQALTIGRAVSDHAGEAATLNNMARVYDAIGQPQRALQLFEQALPIMREIGDRQGEAATLSNLAEVYRATGQPQRALQLFEQALMTMRAVHDRQGEATILNNLAAVYHATGQSQRALQLFEQALTIGRAVGDRQGEANTLNNLATVYQTIGQLQSALQLLEQALPIRRAVGDRAGEAATLNNMAYLAMDMQHFREALAYFEQSIRLERQVEYPAGEIAGLIGMARLLYQHLDHPADAVAYLEQALAVFARSGLPQDAAGQTPERVRELRDAMRSGHTLDAPQPGPQTMPQEHIQAIVGNTIAAMTTMPERRGEWREDIAGALADTQQRGEDRRVDAELFTAIIGILDGQAAALADGHAYATAIAAIQRGIAGGNSQNDP